MPGQYARHGSHEIDQHRTLLVVHCPEVHRGTQVEQEPGRDLPVFDVLPNVGRVHARRDIPVDIADVVLRLVFAQVGEVDAVAVKEVV